jgi:phosphoglycolate phosphatase-like HAD superfamily hydrolase
MRKQIYLDLDGTLIDPRQRMHGLFMELVDGPVMDFDTYWQYKRIPTNQKDMLVRFYNYNDEQIKLFNTAWMQKIEDEKRLAMDQPFAGISERLQQLAENHDLFVVTARQNPAYVTEQLSHFKWNNFFKEVLVTGQTCSKAELVQSVTTPQSHDMFVGDTKDDIETGRQLGVKAIAVCSGFLSGDALRKYNPDFIINSMLDIHETGLLQP